MALKSLDHVNIRTANLDAMVAWYAEVLGMHAGDRPKFGFPGAWLYVGDNPVVHLVGVDRDPANTEPKLEHFAISASGLTEFLDRLMSLGVAHTLDPVPGFPIVQVNLHDCDGNHIHIDFDAAEAGNLPPGRYDLPA